MLQDAPGCYEIKSPKFTRSREDNTNRWKLRNYDWFFSSGHAQRICFRFCATDLVVSKQRIFMTYLLQCGQGFKRLILDGRYLYKDEIEKIAINDGFNTIDEFEEYFISLEMEGKINFQGKIIHWTDLKILIYMKVTLEIFKRCWIKKSCKRTISGQVKSVIREENKGYTERYFIKKDKRYRYTKCRFSSKRRD